MYNVLNGKNRECSCLECSDRVKKCLICKEMIVDQLVIPDACYVCDDNPPSVQVQISLDQSIWSQTCRFSFSRVNIWFRAILAQNWQKSVSSVDSPFATRFLLLRDPFGNKFRTSQTHSVRFNLQEHAQYWLSLLFAKPNSITSN